MSSKTCTVASKPYWYRAMLWDMMSGHETWRFVSRPHDFYRPNVFLSFSYQFHEVWQIFYFAPLLLMLSINLMTVNKSYVVNFTSNTPVYIEKMKCWFIAFLFYFESTVNHYWQILLQSSRKPSGPKTEATKIGWGLVKNWQLEVRRTCHFQLMIIRQRVKHQNISWFWRGVH